MTPEWTPQVADLTLTRGPNQVKPESWISKQLSKERSRYSFWTYKDLYLIPLEHAPSCQCGTCKIQAVHQVGHTVQTQRNRLVHRSSEPQKKLLKEEINALKDFSNWFWGQPLEATWQGSWIHVPGWPNWIRMAGPMGLPTFTESILSHLATWKK